MLVVDRQSAKSLFFKLFRGSYFESEHLGETFNISAFHITTAAFYAFTVYKKMPKVFIV